jgi:hypothetical protein
VTRSIIEPERPIQITASSGATWRVSSLLEVGLREQLIEANSRDLNAARVEEIDVGFWELYIVCNWQDERVTPQRDRNSHCRLNLELQNADKPAVLVPPKEKNSTVALVELSQLALQRAVVVRFRDLR